MTISINYYQSFVDPIQAHQPRHSKNLNKDTIPLLDDRH